MSKILLLLAGGAWGLWFPVVDKVHSEIAPSDDRVQLEVSAENPQARPALPSLPKRQMVGVLINGTWQLDGLNCFNCRFHDAKLTYAGGQFRCVDCWFDGAISVEFTGAAANALALTDWMKQLQGPKRALPPLFAVNNPLQKVSTDALKVTLISPRSSP